MSFQHPSHPELSIVIPVYGCEGCLEELCDRIRATLERMGASFETILVCDASPDHSWERIRELADRDARIRGLRLARNFGQHRAISAGLEHAAGAWIVVMDCDLQCAPESIEALYIKAREGYDVVFAQRVHRKHTLFKRLTSRWFYRVLGYLTETRYDASTAEFGIFSARAIAAVNALPERDRYFPLMVRWSRLPTTSLPIAHEERKSGDSSYTFGKLLQLATQVILSYSDKPLRLVVTTGLVFSAISFFMVIFSVYRYLHGKIEVTGYTSIIASIWFLGGVMTFCVGVVGLYVGRTFNEVKHRPYYVVSEHVNLDSGALSRGDFTSEVQHLTQRSGAGAVACAASPASGVAHEPCAAEPRRTLPDSVSSTTKCSAFAGQPGHLVRGAEPCSLRERVPRRGG